MGNQADKINSLPGNEGFMHGTWRTLSKSNKGGGRMAEGSNNLLDLEVSVTLVNKQDGKQLDKQERSTCGSFKRMREDSVDLLDVEDSVKLTIAEGHHSRPGSKKSRASCDRIACSSVENQENVIFNSSERKTEDSRNSLGVEVFNKLTETDGHQSRQGSKKSGQQVSTSRQGSKKVCTVKALRRQTFNRQGFRRKTTHVAEVSKKLDTLRVDENEGNHSCQGSQKSDHEDCLNGGLKQSCNHCAAMKDSTHWTKKKPLVSTQGGFPVFVQTCSSGQFECTQTGIRWVCHTDVRIRYHALDWELLAGKMESYEPAGPLLNITLVEGELEEIHLPHVLCLGGAEASLHDSVKILHWRESGVSLEKCDLTRFHCKLSKPSFSSLGVIMKSIQYFLPVHVILIHFRVETSPLILHSYLMPEEECLLKRVAEINTGKHQIDLPRPEETLRRGAYYQLKSSCISHITPSKIQLRYPNTVPNFFKVRIEEPGDRFKMELICVNTGECKWTDEFHKDEYCKTSSHKHEGALDSCSAPKITNEAQFIDDHRAALIEHVTCVAPIADEMRSQKLIHEEKYSNIMAEKTSENKMREIYKCLQSSGSKGKAKFYKILLLKEPDLMNDLAVSHHR